MSHSSTQLSSKLVWAFLNICWLLVGRLLRCHKLFTFSVFKTTGPILTKLSTKICSNQGILPFFKEIIAHTAALWCLAHLSWKNHRANFNQTWQKASLGKGDSNFSNEEPCPFPRGDKEIPKIHWRPLKNHRANFNQTWHLASLGDEDSSLFKWRATPFSKGDNNEIVKIHWQTLKIFFLRTTGPISIKLGT